MILTTTNFSWWKWTTHLSNKFGFNQKCILIHLFWTSNLILLVLWGRKYSSLTHELSLILQYFTLGKKWSLCLQSSLMKGNVYHMIFIDNLVCKIQIRFWRAFLFQIGSYLKTLGAEDFDLSHVSSPVRFYSFL